MDPLIRGALGIGNAPWPPDYATLLGLDPTTSSADEVEAAVLERMERLRQYQIRYPEPVTEAMNLLARALDDLTSAGGPAPVVPAEEPALAVEEPMPEVAAPAAAVLTKPTPTPPPADPGVGVFAPSPAPKVYAASAKRYRPPRRAVAPPPVTPALEPVPWGAPTDPRRKAVYDVVRLRHAVDAWEEIG